MSAHTFTKVGPTLILLLRYIFRRIEGNVACGDSRTCWETKPPITVVRHAAVLCVGESTT